MEWQMGDNAQVKAIKSYIVAAHKAGACEKYGGHVPKEKMGRNGKGVAYIGKMTPEGGRRFRQNFDAIDWGK